MTSKEKMEPPPLGKYFWYRAWLGLSDRLMIDPLHARMRTQKIHHGQGVMHMAFHAQGKGFQPLQKEKGVQGSDCRAHVPQQHGPCPRGKGRRSGGLYEAQAVVAGVRLAELGKFSPKPSSRSARRPQSPAQSRAVAAHELGG